MGKLKVAHYVHYDKKFIPQQIEFLNQNFSEEIDQTFFVHGILKEFFQSAPNNVVPLNKLNLIRFIYAAHKSDRIVLNGLFNRKLIFIFVFMPWLVKKSVWIPWGADLYWRLFDRDSIRKAFFVVVKRWFVRRLYGIATSTYGDFENAIKWYGKGPKYINGCCNIFSFELADLNKLVADKFINDIPHIQIGNSGDPTNEHIEIIELFSRHGGENMKIFVPLTYGDKEYINEVIDKGKALLGDKFVALTQFMPPAVYNKYLASVDVVIFNHRRQQGFGNLVISLYLGAKVFIRKEVSVHNYLTEVMGCLIYDTNLLGGIDFQRAIENKIENIQKNRAAVSSLFDRKMQKESWARLYFE